MHKYAESRYRARKKYYDKEENKEIKRKYMREVYYKRPKDIAEREKNRKRYQKDYHSQPQVIEAKKEYIRKYNARPDVKAKRHERYLQKKIQENELLNAINSQRFANV